MIICSGGIIIKLNNCYQIIKTTELNRQSKLNFNELSPFTEIHISLSELQNNASKFSFMLLRFYNILNSLYSKIISLFTSRIGQMIVAKQKKTKNNKQELPFHTFKNDVIIQDIDCSALLKSVSFILCRVCVR